MNHDHELIVGKLRADHQYMQELMQRIRGLCPESDHLRDCSTCLEQHRNLCHENIDQLVRTFIDVTLRHNLLESACMSDHVPRAHRLAHNRAHIRIGEQLRSIRVVFNETGNGVIAVSGITSALAALTAHAADFDADLEQYLLHTA